MKRVCKIFVLLIFVGLLSGCDWKDAQNKYGDILKKGIDCTYYNQKIKNQSKIETFKITANYDGASMSLNNGAAQNIVDANGNYSVKDADGNEYTITMDTINNFLKNGINSDNTFSCPSEVYISHHALGGGSLKTVCNEKSENCEKFKLTPRKDPGSGSNPNLSTDQTLPIDDSITIENLCKQPRVLKGFQIVGYFLFIAKVIVPLLLIIMGIVDFASATIAKDEKANKAAINKLIMRSIAAVVVFLLPTVINYVLILIDDAVETTSKFSNCTECLLDPKNCKNADLGVGHD